MVLFRNHDGKLEPIKRLSFDLEKKIQKITENNLRTIFNLEFVTSEFQLGRFRIDTLAYDEESSSFVIIEYKRGKDSGLFEQGLAYLSVMLDRRSDFVTEYNERLNKNLKKNDVDWSQSRILFISTSFNKEQRQAAILDLHIELWIVHLHENNIVQFVPIIQSDSFSQIKLPSSSKSGIVDKVANEIQTYTEQYHFDKSASKKTIELYEDIKHRILSLADNIEIVIRKPYIAFKSKSNFVYIHFGRNMIHVDLSIKVKELQDPRNIARNMENVGHHGAGYSRITITETSQIPYLHGLIEQSYEKSLKS